MEEMNNTDTPQPQTANTIAIDNQGAPVIDGSDNTNNLSVEDAFFGTSETTTQETPQEGQPQEESGNNAQAEAPYEAKNDDKRYEYWQSQAAKRENELREYQTEVERAVRSSQQQPSRQTPAQQQEFPPPPMKPEKPRTFSREEAWSDSASESAKYLDDVETWQDNMNNYRDLRSQYDIAIVRENMEAQEEQKRINVAKRAQYNAVQKEKQNVYSHVQGHYGLNQEDAAEFVNNMSNPGSISMDNLVQLYRLQKGGAPIDNNSQGPSDAFQQSRNAQQIPSPMGVMPGQSMQSNRSDSDTIMDDLITTHKSKNPWT